MIHATPPPSHIADGVYYYGTRGMAERVITISDSGQRIVDESSNSRLPTYSKIRFNTRTFSVISLRSNLGGPGMWISWRSDGSATFQRTSMVRCEGMPKVICSRPHAVVTPMPGTKRIIPMEAYLLPFIILRSGERKFTIAPGRTLWVTKSCVSRGPRADPTDVCLHVAWTDAADTPADAPNSEDLWYNRSTYVLDRYKIGKEATIDRLICANITTCRDPNGQTTAQPLAPRRP